MGLFSTIMSKIFHHPVATVVATSSSAPAAGAPASAVESATAAVPTPVVDVAAVLDDLASHNSEKLDWHHSIVDLMKLVGMDSSLTNRKALATELHYSGDMGDSATMNVWLHKEVIKQLAANGGKVPANLLD